MGLKSRFNGITLVSQTTTTTNNNYNNKVSRQAIYCHCITHWHNWTTRSYIIGSHHMTSHCCWDIVVFGYIKPTFWLLGLFAWLVILEAQTPARSTLVIQYVCYVIHIVHTHICMIKPIGIRYIRPDQAATIERINQPDYSKWYQGPNNIYYDPAILCVFITRMGPTFCRSLSAANITVVSSLPQWEEASISGEIQGRLNRDRELVESEWGPPAS